MALLLCMHGIVQDLAAAIESRNMKLGKAMFQELTGLRKPIIDENSVLHWPVLLLYAEVMSSDFIEDFSETDAFSDHLDLISFSFTCFHNDESVVVGSFHEMGLLVKINRMLKVCIISKRAAIFIHMPVWSP